MIGIDKKHRDFLISMLKQYIPDKNAMFYLFGSRAKGGYKEYSDIDIAVDLNGKRLPSEILARLSQAFENSIYPYEVDIIDLNNISEGFKRCIEKDLVEICR